MLFRSLTLGVLVAAHVVPGIGYKSAASLAVASLLLGFLNAFLRPILVVLTLPIVIVTLGLFFTVINAALLKGVSYLVPGLYVRDFWAALWGGVVISLVGWCVNRLLGSPATIEVLRTRNGREEKTRVIDI